MSNFATRCITTKIDANAYEIAATSFYTNIYSVGTLFVFQSYHESRIFKGGTLYPGAFFSASVGGTTGGRGGFLTKNNGAFKTAVSN